MREYRSPERAFREWEPLMHEPSDSVLATDPDRSASAPARVEMALEGSPDPPRAVPDTARGGIILIDAHGTIRIFNPACEKLFGYRQDEVVGRNVKMLM